MLGDRGHDLATEVLWDEMCRLTHARRIVLFPVPPPPQKEAQNGWQHPRCACRVSRIVIDLLLECSPHQDTIPAKTPLSAAPEGDEVQQGRTLAKPPPSCPTTDHTQSRPSEQPVVPLTVGTHPCDVSRGDNKGGHYLPCKPPLSEFGESLLPHIASDQAPARFSGPLSSRYDVCERVAEVVGCGGLVGFNEVLIRGIFVIVECVPTDVEAKRRARVVMPV